MWIHSRIFSVVDIVWMGSARVTQDGVVKIVAKGRALKIVICTARATMVFVNATKIGKVHIVPYTWISSVEKHVLLDVMIDRPLTVKQVD